MGLRKCALTHTCAYACVITPNSTINASAHIMQLLLPLRLPLPPIHSDVFSPQERPLAVTISILIGEVYQC